MCSTHSEVAEERELRCTVWLSQDAEVVILGGEGKTGVMEAQLHYEVRLTGNRWNTAGKRSIELQKEVHSAHTLQ